MKRTFFLCLALVSCASRSTTSQAAEAAYTAELLRCVDKATTLHESKACRADVDRKLGITQTAADGGK